MARRWSGAVLTPAPLTAAPFAVIAAPTGGRSRITEIQMFNTAATVGQIGLYRAANTPVQTTSVVTQADDPADAVGVTLIGTAWSTAPTISTNVPLRRIVFPAAIGVGIIWQFEDLVVGPLGTSCLVVWNFGAATAGILALSVVTDG